MRRLLAMVCGVGALVGAGMVAPVGVRAQEPVGGADLEYACTPSEAAIGEDTLLRCTATARNAGSETLANAQLNFAPSSLPVPDRYYFFRYRLDGEEQPTSGGALSFMFGDIAPGESSTIELDVMVRVSRRSGAGVQLVSYAPPSPPVVHDAATVEIDTVEGGVAAVTMRIAPETPAGPDGVATGPLDVVLENNTGAAIEGVTVELAWDEGVRLVGDAAGTWEIDPPSRRARATVDAAPGTTALPLEFAAADSECGFVTTAGIATWDGGAAAALADFGYRVGDCPSFGHGGGGEGEGAIVDGAPDAAPDTAVSGSGDDVRLPSTGAGADARDGAGIAMAVSVALAVAGIGVAGGAVRRRRV